MTLPRKRKKLFSAWQIELTTRCPLSCKMCIRSERDDWQLQDMSLGDFRKIVPYLSEVETVVLEGWGESLLHPNLLECIQLARGEEPEVGFVTSGKGLTRERASGLVLAGLDFIGFSIAGTTEETHDAIRVNSHLPEIINAIRSLQEEKLRLESPHPRIHLVFLMLKDNISEVPEVPSFAREMGIEEVILINLIHVANAWQEDQRIFARGKDESEHQRLVGLAETNARKFGIRLNGPSLSAIDTPICEENPLRNLYISTSGEVSPCVYLYPPLPSPFRRIYRGKEYWVEKVTFGNISKEPFSRIWNSQNYKSFRKSFIDRKDKSRQMYFSPWDGPKIGESPTTFLPEPPEPCKTCHKILGV